MFQFNIRFCRKYWISIYFCSFHTVMNYLRRGMWVDGAKKWKPTYIHLSCIPDFLSSDICPPRHRQTEPQSECLIEYMFVWYKQKFNLSCDLIVYRAGHLNLIKSCDCFILIKNPFSSINWSMWLNHSRNLDNDISKCHHKFNIYWKFKCMFSLIT